jgi:very-short-patch-repair endonuclease
MQTVREVLGGAGGAATRRVLLRSGFSPRLLARLVATGEVVRPMRGWYALPELPSEIIRSVRVGGCVACVSAARLYGLAVPAGDTLHVWVSPGSGRLREPDDRSRRLDPSVDKRVVLHWNDHALDRSELVVPLDRCLAQVVACQPPEIAIATLDSAVHVGRRTMRGLEVEAQRWPAASRSLLCEVDGSAESFVESILRVRLRREGIPCRPQVRVAGRYRLDLLVGDRLAIEVDGYDSHHEHEQIENDRQREAVLVALGFRILRFTYRQVMYDWPAVVAAIRACLDRGDHL